MKVQYRSGFQVTPRTVQAKLRADAKMGNPLKGMNDLEGRDSMERKKTWTPWLDASGH